MTSLDRLVEGLFDYAGLFPPAALEFDDALKTSAGASQRLKRPGIVGADFVLGFDRLHELTPERLLERGFPKAKTVRLAVLGPTVDTPDPIEHARQIEAIQSFNEAHASDLIRQRVVSYEVKLDLNGFENRENARVALDRVRRELGAQTVRLYIEPDWDEGAWEDRWDWFWETLDSLNAAPEHPSVCPKVRGSGPTAITVERLARFITAVNQRSLPFKATAGLHHPIVEKDLYGNTLGFLSLATALRLQRRLGPEAFPESVIASCLRESSVENFGFEDGLSWKNFKMTMEELRDAVLSHPFGIGSCSVDDPDADLTRLLPSIEPVGA